MPKGSQLRTDDREAYYAPGNLDGATVTVTLDGAAPHYADLDPGYYTCWCPDGTTGGVITTKYLDHVADTVVLADLQLPAPVAQAQTPKPITSYPANTKFEMHVPPPDPILAPTDTKRRVAVLYALNVLPQPTQLICVQVYPQ